VGRTSFARSVGGADASDFSDMNTQIISVGVIASGAIPPRHPVFEKTALVKPSSQKRGTKFQLRASIEIGKQSYGLRPKSAAAGS
jgi:hypothetical protein